MRRGVIGKCELILSCPFIKSTWEGTLKEYILTMSTHPEKLHTKIWSGEYGPDDIARVERMVARGEATAGALASMLYSYATRLKSQGNTAEYERYLSRAVTALEQISPDHAPVNELDVMQSVLREAGKYKEAREVIERALSLEDVPVHTRALLLVGKAEVFQQEGEAAEAQKTMEAVAGMVEEVRALEPKQAIRLYRALMRFYQHLGQEERARAAEKEARSIIEKTGANDQLIKLENDLK